MLGIGGNRIRTYWPGINQPHSMRTWENGAGGVVHYYALDLPSGNVRGLFNMSGTLTHSYQYWRSAGAERGHAQPAALRRA